MEIDDRRVPGEGRSRRASRLELTVNLARIEIERGMKVKICTFSSASAAEIKRRFTEHELQYVSFHVVEEQPK